MARSTGIGADGKSAEFYDPKQKYIWAMVFGPDGDLFIATGDRGEVHRVEPDGKGSVFFKTEETHARSLAFDAKGNLIVGTEPGGLVIRVDAQGRGIRALPDVQARGNGRGRGDGWLHLCRGSGAARGHPQQRRPRFRLPLQRQRWLCL